MRLLIYLLALISGFSAAEAARAEVSPASSVAQTAVAAAEGLAAQEQVTVARPVDEWPRENIPFQPATTLVALLANTPILRHDLSRE
jgi:predicted RNA polymerase sigma factor